MNLVLSYGTKIRSECSAMDTMLLQTAAVYTEMLSFIADVCRKEEHICDKKGGGMNAVNVLEPMIHKTKGNPNTLYDFFNVYFPKNLFKKSTSFSPDIRSIINNQE